jgi:TM2 domain-containing membrane protein YozV
MEMAGFSQKSRLVALLLSWFFGYFGAHRFYANKYGTAVLMILTLGGFGIWWIVDLILIAVGSFRDSKGLRVYRWLEPGSA